METYIYDFVRTPIGRGHPEKGALKSIRPLDLLAQLIHAVAKRNGITDDNVDELILGLVGQVGDQGGNLAKIGLSYMGWDTTPGFCINSYCSSGMVALSLAAGKVHSGLSGLVLAGGVEMLSRVPMYADRSPLYSQKDYMERTRFTQMGVAADLIATLEGFEKDELDDYAVLSHKRAAHAMQNGYFDRSLIPVENESGAVALAHDENIKPHTSKETLQKFEPLFASAVTPFVRDAISDLYLGEVTLNHQHHVGNSPNMADGACLLLVGNLEKGKALGLKPRAKIITTTEEAVQPLLMLTGGQKSVQSAFKTTGLNAQDMDFHFYAEAFSSSCLKYLKDMKVDLSVFNPIGGTMSMGHAQGASGATLTGLLLEELERTDKEMGVAAISGLAQGSAVIIQRV